MGERNSQSAVSLGKSSVPLPKGLFPNGKIFLRGPKHSCLQWYSVPEPFRKVLM